MKPLQAISMSKAAVPTDPELRGDDASRRRKDVVGRDRRDDDAIDVGWPDVPARFERVLRGGAVAMSLVEPSSRGAMRRSCMPVRETIHSSVVSSIFSKSSLVMTRSGT